MPSVKFRRKLPNIAPTFNCMDVFLWWSFTSHFMGRIEPDLGSSITLILTSLGGQKAPGNYIQKKCNMKPMNDQLEEGRHHEFVINAK